jgi:hypothetical protein
MQSDLDLFRTAVLSDESISVLRADHGGLPMTCFVTNSVNVALLLSESPRN